MTQAGSGSSRVRGARQQQRLLVLTFTQEAHEAPDEVAAAVAEGGLGQRDPPEAVPRCGAVGPGPEPRGLLPPLPHGQRALRAAGRGLGLRPGRSGPSPPCLSTLTRSPTGEGPPGSRLGSCAETRGLKEILRPERRVALLGVSRSCPRFRSWLYGSKKRGWANSVIHPREDVSPRLDPAPVCLCPAASRLDTEPQRRELRFGPARRVPAVQSLHLPGIRAPPPGDSGASLRSGEEGSGLGVVRGAPRSGKLGRFKKCSGHSLDPAAPRREPHTTPRLEGVPTPGRGPRTRGSQQVWEADRRCSQSGFPPPSPRKTSLPPPGKIPLPRQSLRHWFTPPSSPPSLHPSFSPSLLAPRSFSPPSIPPSLNPSFSPSLLPSFSPSLLLSIPPSLLLSLRPSFLLSIPPSLPPSISASFSPSLLLFPFSFLSSLILCMYRLYLNIYIYIYKYYIIQDDIILYVYITFSYYRCLSLIKQVNRFLSNMFDCFLLGFVWSVMDMLHVINMLTCCWHVVDMFHINGAAQSQLQFDKVTSHRKWRVKPFLCETEFEPLSLLVSGAAEKSC